MKHGCTTRMVFLVSLGVLASAAAWSENVWVQVENTAVRSRASYLGTVVDSVAYGEGLTVLGRSPGWIQVSGPRGGRGWIHESATTVKVIRRVEGGADVDTAASSDELALAGKGFSREVESSYRARNRDVDFSWIDRMEKLSFEPEELQRFLKEGGLSIDRAGGGS